MGTNAVPGFLPSVHGLRFANAFPPGPTLTFAGLDPRRVGFGDASAGLCGGMALTARDLYEAGALAPVDAAQPDTGDVEEHLAAAAGELQAWTEQLRAADATDVARWRQETVDAATVASVMSPPLAIPSDRADRTQPIPTSTVLGRGADALTRLSLGDRATPDGSGPAPAVPSGPSHAELAARHLMIALRASSPDSHRGWLAVMQQFSRTVGAIRDAHQVRGELAAAHRVHQVALSALADVQERLQQLDRAAAAGGAQVQETAFEDLSPAAQRVRASMLHGTPGGRLRLDPDAEGGRGQDPQRPRSTGGPDRRSVDHARFRERFAASGPVHRDDRAC